MRDVVVEPSLPQQEPLRAVLVLLLCMLQVFAVSIDAIPQDAGGLPRAFPSFFAPLMGPYLAATAQWQRWNLFAPNPLQEVSTLFIERKEENGWRVLWTIAPGEASFWRETALLKVARALSDEDARYDTSRQIFLRRFCELHVFSPETRMRLRVRSYDLREPAVVKETVRSELSCTDT